MTRTEISKELFDLMNKPPEKKQDVSHALVQIRKITEFDHQQQRDGILVFFCDWSLHTKLDRSVAAKEIVRLLDESFKTFRPWLAGSDQDRIISRVVSFDLFREKLHSFLGRNDLPTVWTEDQFAWQKVIDLYEQQVRNTPLVITRKDYHLLYTQRVVVSACDPTRAMMDANPGGKWTGFMWEFTLNDGHKFSHRYVLNVSLPPEGWVTQGVREA